MVRIALLLVSICCFAFISTQVFAQDISSGQDSSSVNNDCNGNELALMKRAAKSAWSHKQWKSGPNRNKLRSIKQMRVCLNKDQTNKYKKTKQKYIYEFRIYKRYRDIAEFPGLREGDPYLEYLVTPAWVVSAETRGYYGRGRWRAINPSGACGPYQLLGHTSCTVEDNADKLRHHLVAAGLPRGSWEVGY